MPTVLTLLVLGVYPLVFILLGAFSDSTLGKPFRGWNGGENFRQILADRDVVDSLWLSTGYSLAVTACSTLLGLVIALALFHAASTGSVVRTIVLLPLIIPPVIVGTLWKYIYNPSGGLIVTAAGLLGFDLTDFAPLADPKLALAAIGVADVWEWSPLVSLLVFTALLGQDRTVLEAAQLDGARGFRHFRSITLPEIAGTLAAAAFIRLVLALKVFDLIFIMTSGGPGTATTTASYAIYQIALREFDLGRASALTLLLAVVVTLLTLPVAWLTRKLNRRYG